MESNSIYNKEELISLRQHFHQFPELAFAEHETVKTIIDYLSNKCKIPIECIQQGIGKTGLVVDIRGKANPEGKDFCVAFRADMDCLPMEENTGLPYTSKIPGKAHSCGHDGHITSLLGLAALVSQNLNSIPSNKITRLLFQPAEEFCRKNNTGGAKLMVEDGCMKGVDEVYGYHNVPSFPLGHLAVKEGPVMSAITVIKFIVLGKGGHASVPHLSNNPVDAGVDVYLEIKKIEEKFNNDKRKFVMCFPMFNAGTADNVIPDTSEIAGTVRTLEIGLEDEILKEFGARLPIICQKHNCSLETIVKPGYPIVDNHKEQADIIERLGKNQFGEKLVDKSLLPIMASEDFSYFLIEKPGCFFFIGGKEKEDEPGLHCSNYNFKDSNLDVVSKFYLTILLDRFGLDKSKFK